MTKALPKTSGIYKLVFTPTKEFYIGATRNFHQRWHSHKSHFRSNNNHSQLQALFNTSRDIEDWKFVILETCKVASLERREQIYLNKHRYDKGCLNVHFRANCGRRNVPGGKETKEQLAMSLLGKNTTQGIRRPNNLTFISPEGVEYPHVISVKGFAEEHGLGQVPMNELANGEYNTHAGWTMKGSEIPFAANVVDYWSRERMLQNYPEYIIIGPDGTEYRTFVPYHFEQEHNCTILMRDPGKNGVKKSLKGLDKYGRGYRMSNIASFKITYEGTVYENVISVPKWAYGVGIGEKWTYYANLPKDHKYSKKAKRFTVEKIVP